MKYINQNDLMMFLEKPITRLSVFEVETIDAALVMCAEAFLKIEKDFKVTIDFPTFKYQLLKTMGEFLSNCRVCDRECLKHTHQRVDEERYQSNQIVRKLWPARMQKTTSENFFFIEYCLTYADILFRYLLDASLPKELSHPLADMAMQQLAKWIDDNCIAKCHYECIRRSESNGYCTLCSFMIQPLLCPNKQEISLSALGLDKDELQCMRREETYTKKDHDIIS